jgi:hypothetical protein
MMHHRKTTYADMHTHIEREREKRKVGQVRESHVTGSGSCRGILASPIETCKSHTTAQRVREKHIYPAAARRCEAVLFARLR